MEPSILVIGTPSVASSRTRGSRASNANRSRRAVFSGASGRPRNGAKNRPSHANPRWRRAERLGLAVPDESDRTFMSMTSSLTLIGNHTAGLIQEPGNDGPSVALNCRQKSCSITTWPTSGKKSGMSLKYRFAGRGAAMSGGYLRGKRRNVDGKGAGSDSGRLQKTSARNWKIGRRRACDAADPYAMHHREPRVPVSQYARTRTGLSHGWLLGWFWITGR